MTFLQDLKAFLQVHEFSNITCDMMLDKPDDCIGLFLYNHVIPAINDGSGTRYIQVQCRDKDPESAYKIAHGVAALLDSGEDEAIIHLTPERWCIARPTKLPRKLSVDASKRTIYYCEFTLWGDNTP